MTQSPAKLSSSPYAVSDRDSIPAAPATPLKRLRRIALLGNALIGFFIAGVGYWSAHASLESAAIAAGTVEVETSRKTIQHLEGGIVREILVRDGDRVLAGQPLIRLEDTRARTQVAVLASRRLDARAREARLVAERAGLDTIVFPRDLVEARATDPTLAAVLAGQEAIFESRRAMIDARRAAGEERAAQLELEIEGLEAQRQAAESRAAIIDQEIAGVQTLVDKGLMPLPRLLALKREKVEIQGRVGETKAAISRARQAIAEVRAGLLAMESEWRNETDSMLHETQGQLVELAETIEAAGDRLARTVIHAPQSGTITDLRIGTAGGVIASGEKLMDLVPEADKLVIDARLRPEDVDVVRAGQPADVRLLAYVHRAPPLSGTVTQVSADRLVDPRTDLAYYTLKVRVDDPRLQAGELEMVPGMPVQVFVKTGENTVALYALRPFLDSLERAFRED